jgi:hypothetical protein
MPAPVGMVAGPGGLLNQASTFIHRAKARFSQLEIHVCLKNVCHILSVTCENVGTRTLRGACTPAAILVLARTRLHTDIK